MRIAYVIPALNNQAPIIVATTLAELMAERGHSVTIFYFDPHSSRELSSSVLVKRIGFFDKISWESFDVVHSHMLRADVYSFIHKPLFCKTKAVTTSHNYMYKELKNHYNFLVSIVFGTLWNISWTRMDKICVLTKDASRYYSKISLNKRIAITYNGRSIAISKPNIALSAKELCSNFRSQHRSVIGTYCNLTYGKRIDRLIRLLCDLKGVGLIVIGDGIEKENLSKLAGELNVQDRVLFVGYQLDAHSFNQFFDVFAMPSDVEGFGLALIEAALHGKKIICSDIPVFRELFDERSVCFFGPDSSSIKVAFETAITSSGKASAAQKIAEQNFSDIAMVERYVAVYSEILNY